MPLGAGDSGILKRDDDEPKKKLTETYFWYGAHQKWLAGKEDGSRANLNGSNLRGADLIGADLRRADLRGVDLREADLREANLSGADLRWANLSGANLSEANLRGAVLCDCNLDGAVVTYRGASVRVTFTKI